MRYLLIYILLSTSWLAKAQITEFERDYALAKDVFKDKQISLESDYLLFSSHTSTSLVSTAKSTTFISEELYNQSIEGVHTIIEGDRVLICDTNEENLVVDNYKGDLLAAVFSIDIDQLSNFITKVDPISTSDVSGYRLYIQYSEIEMLDIYIDKENHHFEKVILYYAYAESLGEEMSNTDNPRLEIAINPYKFDDSRFWTISKNPFISWNQERPIVEKDYKDYNFINNISSQ